MSPRAACLPVLGLATLLFLAPSAAAWSNSYLAGYDVIGDLALGDGDGDGKREVYAATWDGTKRYAWNGTAWAETHLGSTDADSIALGDADRDGAREVYAGEARQGANDVVRYEKTADGWSRTVLATFGQEATITTLSGGDLEGDGHQDLLLALSNDDGDIYKVFYKNGAWQQVKLAQVHARVLTSWVGDGDRDGKPEVYLGTSKGDVLELDPDDGWDKTFVGWVGTDSEWIQGVVVADGDGDGLEEVYAAGDNASIMRFGWTGSAWNRNKIATFPSALTDLTFADGDGDGDKELYTTSWNGHVYSVHRSGSSWVKTDLGELDDEGSPLTIVAGDGDNDGSVDLFVGDMHNAQYPYGHLHRYEA